MTGLIPPVSPLAYEGTIAVPYIIRNFPPEPTFNTFPVPTIWIDPEHEEAYIQVAKPTGSAVWVNISSVPGVLFTITTPTGTVVPSAGNVNFINGVGISINGSGNNITFSIQVPLAATLGGTGQTTYNIGDILYASATNTLSRLPIGTQNQALVVNAGIPEWENRIVASNPPVTDMAFVRWDGTTGFFIENSLTTQDNNGNILTRTSNNTSLSLITANESTDSSSTTVCALESVGGRPIYRHFIPSKQLVDSYISNNDYSYNIFLNNLEGSFAADCFRIFRNGSISTPFQLKCSAYLSTNTADVTGDNSNYALGSTVALTIYNQIGNGFFVGDGAGTAAYYMCEEQGTFGFFLNVYAGISGSVAVPSGQTLTFINHYDTSNNLIKTYQSFCTIVAGVTNAGANVTKGITMNVGERVTFTVQCGLIGSARRIFLLGQTPNTIRTYIDIYKLG